MASHKSKMAAYETDSRIAAEITIDKRRRTGVHYLWKRNFRRRLIKAYDAEKEPGEKGRKHTALWCPILCEYRPRYEMYATILFPDMQHRTTLERIFVTPPPTRFRDNEPAHVYSSKNGLLVSLWFAELWDKGLMTIVPDLSNDASEEDRLAWDTNDTKNYKLKILDHNAEEMLEMNTIEDQRPFNGRWIDFDNCPLEFLNDFRPSPQYLFWHFCTQVFRYVARTREESQSIEARTTNLDISERLWGSRGKYIYKPDLDEFVDEVGDDWAFLKQHGIEKAEAPEDWTYLGEDGKEDLQKGEQGKEKNREWLMTKSMLQTMTEKVAGESDGYESSGSQYSLANSHGSDNEWD